VQVFSFLLIAQDCIFNPHNPVVALKLVPGARRAFQQLAEFLGSSLSAIAAR